MTRKKWHRIGLVGFLAATSILWIRCNNGIYGKVIGVNGNQLVVRLSENRIRIGEKFSIWRDTVAQKENMTYRAGIIEITGTGTRDLAEGILVSGDAKIGDKVTKWLIEE